MKKTLILILSLITMSNCILWYTGEPDPLNIEIEPRQSAKFILNYSVATSNTDFKLAARQGLDSTGYFASSIEHYSLLNYVDKQKGDGPYFMDITIKEKPFEGLGVVWTYLTWYFLLGILPGWTEDGLNVEVKMYQNQDGNYRVVDSFIYSTTRWGISWLGNVPFLWANLLTWSKEDVISLCVQDYVARISSNQTIAGLPTDHRPLKVNAYNDTLILNGNRVLHSVRVIEGVHTVTVLNQNGEIGIFDLSEVQKILHAGQPST